MGAHDQERARMLEQAVIETLDDYQAATARTAVYPGQGGFIGMVYATLGVGGEAGEVSDQVKKTWRDDGADIQSEVERAIERFIVYLRPAMSGKIADRLDDLRKEVSIAFNPPLTPERRKKLIKEMGDALWYISQLATEIDVSLVDVAQLNIDKLAERHATNTLHGEGDDREKRSAPTTHTRPDPFGGPDMG